LRRGELRDFVFNESAVFHDLAVTLQLDHAGAAVDMRADVMIVAVFRAARFLDGFFHRTDDDFTVDVFFSSNVVSDLQQFHDSPF
jgi:hypothetical protein